MENIKTIQLDEVRLNKVSEVLDFIEETIDLFNQTPLHTKHGISAYNYFTRGGCGHFYTILKANFPEAKPYLTIGGGHVVTEIDGIIYDVHGISNEFILQVDLPENVIKVVSNFAFSLRSCSWFGERPGPTNACFLKALEDMTQEQRDECFSFFAKYDMFFFEDEYKNLHLFKDSPIYEIECSNLVYPIF